MRLVVQLLLVVLLLVLSTSAEDSLDAFVSPFDFAAEKAGAKVIDTSSKEIVGADNLLESNRDRYMMIPCKEQPAWIVLQLAEDVTICKVQISNLEYFANSFQDLQLLGSSVYPTKMFVSLGTIRANNSNAVQSFRISEGRWSHIRYLKIRFISHYESSAQYYYCTMTSFQVYGVRALEKLEREIKKLEEKAKKALEEKKISPNLYVNGSSNPFDLVDRSVDPDPFTSDDDSLKDITDLFAQVSDQPQHIFEKLAHRLSVLEKVQIQSSKLFRARVENTLKIVHSWISVVNESLIDHNKKAEYIFNDTAESVHRVLKLHKKTYRKLKEDLTALQIKYISIEQYLYMLLAGLCVVCIVCIGSCVCMFRKDIGYSKATLVETKFVPVVPNDRKQSGDTPLILNTEFTENRALRANSNSETSRMARRSSDSFLKRIFSSSSPPEDDKETETPPSTTFSFKRHSKNKWNGKKHNARK